MSDIRLIVCFDIVADTVADAYAKLANKLDQTGLAYETGEPCYVDGEPITEEELSNAILQVLEQREDAR